MDEHTLDEMVRGLAQAVRAFLDALDPASETLDRITDAGYDLHVLVTASPKGEPGLGLGYLIEFPAGDDPGASEANDRESLAATVEEFLQSLARDEGDGRG